jgi:hypothetical protein
MWVFLEDMVVLACVCGVGVGDCSPEKLFGGDDEART